jgi:hypothetical protein
MSPSSLHLRPDACCVSLNDLREVLPRGLHMHQHAISACVRPCVSLAAMLPWRAYHASSDDPCALCLYLSCGAPVCAAVLCTLRCSGTSRCTSSPVPAVFGDIDVVCAGASPPFRPSTFQAGAILRGCARILWLATAPRQHGNQLQHSEDTFYGSSRVPTCARCWAHKPRWSTTRTTQSENCSELSFIVD